MKSRPNILGVGVSAINMGQALETIQGWIADHDPHYVCVAPAHWPDHPGRHVARLAHAA